MADVGNGHQQAPPLATPLFGANIDRLTVHGVVKVARVLSVNCDKWHITQIHAAIHVPLRHCFRQGIGLGQRRFGKAHRHVKLTYRNFDLHARVIDFAKHFNNASEWLGMAGWLLHDFNRDNLPVLGATDIRCRHQDVVLDTLILGRNHINALLLQQATDKPVRASFQHLDNGAFRLAAILSGRLDLHPIAVQHFQHFARGQKQILTAIFGDQKAKAITMPLNTANDVVFRLGRDLPAFWCIVQLPVTLHGSQAFFQTVHTGLPREVKVIDKLLQRQGLVGAAQQIQDIFPRRDVRIIILTGLGQRQRRLLGIS